MNELVVVVPVGGSSELRIEALHPDLFDDLAERTRAVYETYTELDPYYREEPHRHRRRRRTLPKVDFLPPPEPEVYRVDSIPADVEVLAVWLRERGLAPLSAPLGEALKGDETEEGSFAVIRLNDDALRRVGGFVVLPPLFLTWPATEPTIPLGPLEASLGQLQDDNLYVVAASRVEVAGLPDLIPETDIRVEEWLNSAERAALSDSLLQELRGDAPEAAITLFAGALPESIELSRKAPRRDAEKPRWRLQMEPWKRSGGGTVVALHDLLIAHQEALLRCAVRNAPAQGLVPRRFTLEVRGEAESGAVRVDVKPADDPAGECLARVIRRLEPPVAKGETLSGELLLETVFGEHEGAAKAPVLTRLVLPKDRDAVRLTEAAPIAAGIGPPEGEDPPPSTPARPHELNAFRIRFLYLRPFTRSSPCAEPKPGRWRRGR